MTTHDKLAYKNGIIQLIRAKTLALASGNCHSPLPSSTMSYRIETSSILMNKGGQSMVEETIVRYMREGKFYVLPRKQKNRLEVFQYIYQHLKQYSQEFTEPELNERIKEVYEDFATMRRYLVDYKYLIRDNYGKSYQLNPQVGQAPQTEAAHELEN